ncbi:hypothetical protein B0H13DRAFT_1921501 [Mycena leptocephala]|nr:hypothetical protein B0H13DRAFT_1921501 [Mycena leptocephala]
MSKGEYDMLVGNSETNTEEQKLRFPTRPQCSQMLTVRQSFNFDSGRRQLPRERLNWAWPLPATSLVPDMYPICCFRNYREYRDFEPRQVMCHRRDKSRNQISSKHPQICGVFPGQFSCASAWGLTTAVVVGIHNPRNSGGIQIERNLGPPSVEVSFAICAALASNRLIGSVGVQCRPPNDHIVPENRCEPLGISDLRLSESTLLAAVVDPLPAAFAISEDQ